MRATHDAIMVGVGTALADDPALTVRLPGVDLKPLRVVLDSRLRLAERSRLAATAREVRPSSDRRAGCAGRGEADFWPSGVEVARVGVGAEGRVDLGKLAGARRARGHPRLQRGRPQRRRAADRARAGGRGRLSRRPSRWAGPAAGAGREALAALADPARYQLIQKRKLLALPTKLTRCGFGNGRDDQGDDGFPAYFPHAVLEPGRLFRQEFGVKDQPEVKTSILVKDRQSFWFRPASVMISTSVAIFIKDHDDCINSFGHVQFHQMSQHFRLNVYLQPGRANVHVVPDHLG